MAATDTAGQFSIYTQAFGVGMQAAGAYGASKAAKIAYEYQAMVASNNARLGEWQAGQAITRGQTLENNVRQKGAQVAGTQRAAMAARGLDVNSADTSASNILTDTAFMTERDALTTRDNAAKEAWAIRMEATNSSNNALLYQARAAGENPTMAAVGSLVGGASSVNKSWYEYMSRRGGGGSTAAVAPRELG